MIIYALSHALPSLSLSFSFFLLFSAHKHMDIYVWYHLHTHTHMQISIQAYPHTHSHTHKYACKHPPTPHTHTHLYMHTHACSNIWTKPIHIYICSHTHFHVCLLALSEACRIVCVQWRISLQVFLLWIICKDSINLLEKVCNGIHYLSSEEVALLPSYPLPTHTHFASYPHIYFLSLLHLNSFFPTFFPIILKT